MQENFDDYFQNIRKIQQKQERYIRTSLFHMQNHKKTGEMIFIISPGFLLSVSQFANL
jgi:hypothetical protein